MTQTQWQANGLRWLASLLEWAASHLEEVERESLRECLGADCVEKVRLRAHLRGL